LHHDNAPAHASLLIYSYLAKHQISVVPHPPYSPDLGPADFFLFPKLKTTLKGRCFQTIEEIEENATRTARDHRKCLPRSIPTMEEMLGTVYRQ
jgi:transposase